MNQILVYLRKICGAHVAHTFIALRTITYFNTAKVKFKTLISIDKKAQIKFIDTTLIYCYIDAYFFLLGCYMDI
jgi:hypothetical protein